MKKEKMQTVNRQCVGIDVSKDEVETYLVPRQSCFGKGKTNYTANGIKFKDFSRLRIRYNKIEKQLNWFEDRMFEVRIMKLIPKLYNIFSFIVARLCIEQIKAQLN